MWKRFLVLIVIMLVITGCNVKETTKQSKSTDTDNKEEQNKDNNKHADEEKGKHKEDSKEVEKNIKAKYKINENLWTIEPINKDTNEKVVLLTIDDAPDKYAVEMAKTLKKLDVPAIFFVNGHFLEGEEKQNELKEIANMGFEIGNHTYSHKSLPELSESEQIEEIQSVNKQVEETIGKKPDFFRAPFGENTDATKQFIKEEDMHLMNWTYGYDWNPEYQTEAAVKDIMINAPELNDGANLLMHDREWTNAALEDIVRGLKEKGYDFVNPKEIEGYHPN